MGITLQKGWRSGELEVLVEWHEKTVRVCIRGALDFYCVPDAKRLLLDLFEHEPGCVIVDVSDAFVDSTGIGVLVHVAQRARLERRGFRLVCHEQLAAILRLHKLDDVLGIGRVLPVPDLERFHRTHRIAA
jgi:anti-anti-sigma factor